MTISEIKQLSDLLHSTIRDVLADVSSWDFLTPAGKQQVREVCASFHDATVREMLSDAGNPGLEKVFQERISDLHGLKDACQTAIVNAQNGAWLKDAMDEAAIETAKMTTGFRATMLSPSLPC
jgi:hypothetical protein